MYSNWPKRAQGGMEQIKNLKLLSSSSIHTHRHRYTYMCTLTIPKHGHTHTHTQVGDRTNMIKF